ncbi:MAG TPA: protein kinase [Vicinamibacterales bacterium]|nr:protein kinase [Vicinamibacterales bacterium]
MALTLGTRLGPYEILAAIGAGGMGEVYRAKDTRLDREVAIKVLPTSLAGDPDRRARFEREAKAVAALSHPNILAIHDVGAQGETTYAVTELLDGETLRERLTQHGALPVRKAIDVAVQIARGLAAAHDKGLIHRDLKPENVFLLKDGQVKILDFGLARQTAAPAGSGATQTVAATDPGTVMGTVGYMAPEQVRGQAMDARTDLFALGAVLCEMLSGQRAFQRETPADTMTAILKEDPPDLSATRADLSPALDRIVRHCLEKNPAERFQTARDIAFALEAFSGTSLTAVSGAVRAAASAPAGWRRPLTMALVAIAGLAAGVLADRAIRPAPASIAFETKTWDSEWITNARFSPDGQTIVFSAAPTGNVPQLFVIRPGTVTSQPLGEPGVHLLSISSKGELAVITGAQPVGHRLFRGTLARMTMDGAPRPWMEHISEADWSPDGSTLAVTRDEGGKVRLEYPIGKVLYESSGGYLSDLRVSPDGTRVAFFDHHIPGDNRGWVKVVDASGTAKILAGEYFSLEGLAWSPDGRAVFFSGSGQGAESMQPLVVNVAGTPAVRQALAGAGAMFIQDVTRDGRLLVMRDDLRASLRALVPGESAEREFAWLDFAYRGFLSRERKFLVFGDESQSAGTNYAVALRDVSSSRVLRLGEGSLLSLSPDDKWAAALIPSTEQVMLYPTGPGDAVKLDRGALEHIRDDLQWFPDGHRVLICGNEAGKAARCYAQEVPGGAPRAVTPDGTSSALLADDGRTLLLRSSAGAYQVMSIGGGPAADVKGLTPADFPFSWTRDGRGIVVVAGFAIPTRIERVDVATGARTPIKELAPPDRAGVNVIVPNQWIEDGRGYVYSYFRELSKLFVASGVTK